MTARLAERRVLLAAVLAMLLVSSASVDKDGNSTVRYIRYLPGKWAARFVRPGKIVIRISAMGNYAHSAIRGV